jgi:hypothetical protein
VTVGSFNSVGMPLPDGRTELDPKILLIMKTFGATPSQKQIAATDVLNTELKSLMGINFDIQPIPVLVPKASISTSMNRGAAEQNRIDFRE